MPRKTDAASPASELARTVTANAAMKTITVTARFISPFFCVLRSILTQFSIFKQHCADGQRRARIANHVSKCFADVSPLKRAFARVNGVGEPEKLPVRDDAVKR